MKYDPSDPRFDEPPSSSPATQRDPATDTWRDLPINQQPLPDRTNVERLERVLSFAAGALFGAPAGFGLFVTTVHSDTVYGLEWKTAAWIFIAASALVCGYLLARVKPTLR